MVLRMINAVVIAVILMIILCLCRLNVVISLFISALVGGMLSGMSLEKVINIFGKNIVDGAEVALSYALLGGFAALISYSGITDYLVGKIIKAIHSENSRLSRVKVKVIIIVALLAMSIMSQNLIPVHIAFIPIVIPPLLSLFNDLNMDRRLIGLVIDLVYVGHMCYYHMDLVKYSTKLFKAGSKRRTILSNLI